MLRFLTCVVTCILFVLLFDPSTSYRTHHYAADLNGNQITIGDSGGIYGLFHNDQLIVGDDVTRTVTGNGQFISRRNSANATIRTQSFGAGYRGYFACDKAGGTAGSPTALGVDEPFCSLIGVGADGVDPARFAHGPEITLMTSEPWTGSAHGSQIKVIGVLNGSTTQIPLIWANRGGKGDVDIPNGNLIISSPGKTLAIDSGTPASACKGTATLNGAIPVTVNTTCAAAGMHVDITRTSAGIGGNVYFNNVVHGSSFDVTSVELDTGTVSWLIIQDG